MRDIKIVPPPPAGEKQKFTCPGSVLQTGISFTLSTGHTCPGTVDLQELVALNAEAKEAGMEHKWSSGKALEDPLMQKYNDASPGMDLPKTKKGTQSGLEKNVRNRAAKKIWTRPFFHSPVSRTDFWDGPVSLATKLIARDTGPSPNRS